MVEAVFNDPHSDSDEVMDAMWPSQRTASWTMSLVKRNRRVIQFPNNLHMLRDGSVDMSRRTTEPEPEPVPVQNEAMEHRPILLAILLRARNKL